MEPPTEPSKPAHESEADAALAASAANAVEQWRNYQNAYYLYQQQQAAYEQYMMKQATLTDPDQQAAAYNEYLAAHQGYQKQLEQYEQQKYYQDYYGSGQQVTATPIVYPTAAQITYQPPPTMPEPPAYSSPLANVDPYYKKKDHYRDRSHYKKRSENYEKKTKVYTTTNYYATPEDEQLFPADLKALFHDLECKLCMCKMNSHISANVHYQSKVHERKIVQWLKEWCETTGTPMPIRAKRKAVDVEPVGPNSLRCEACDLPLTSIQHANQHYTGKRHQMVVRGKKNPAGKGYFNADGTWTRTPNDGPEDPTDDRFGIGTSFRNKTHYSAHEAKKAKLEPPPEPPSELMGTTATPTTTIPATPVYSMPSTPAYGVPPVTSMYMDTSMYQTAPPSYATPSYAPPQITTYNAAPPAATAYQVPQPVNAYQAAPPATTYQAAPPATTYQATPPATTYPAAPPATTYQAAPPETTYQAPPPETTYQAPPPVTSTTTEEEIQRKESADCVDPTGVFCLVCQIGVTSRTVMETHLKGAKHLKKLKTSGRMEPRNGSETESILDTLHKPPQQNDWSLYRMPSGKYYCKSCNSILDDEKLFAQHWYGKRHKLKVKQEMEELAAENGGHSTGKEGKKFYNRRPFGKNRF